MKVNQLLPNIGKLLSKDNSGVAQRIAYFAFLLLVSLIMAGIAIVGVIGYSLVDMLKFW